MSLKKIKTIRKWLNPMSHPDSGWAKVSGAVWTRKSSKGKVYKELDLELLVADCSRSIRLDFSCEKKEAIKDRRKKLDVLYSMLDHISSEIDKYEELVSGDGDVA